MTDSDHNLDAIVNAGICFMQAITAYYGAEKGMMLWDVIKQSLDKEVYGQIFFTMIAGNQPGTVYISRTPTCNNAVGVIKAIREYTDLGLKEAKEIWDQTVYSQAKVVIRNLSDRSAFINRMTSLGMLC